MDKLKSDHSSLAKDMEDSRSARVEATKRDESVEARALKAEERLKQVESEVEKRVAAYTKTAEFDIILGKESAATVINVVDKFQGECPQLLGLFNRFKGDWPEYFEGMSMDVPGETIEVADESAEREVPIVRGLLKGRFPMLAMKQ
ncbi:hypothetical protein LIER_10870 [Lithospermum erythrorhizon]